MNVIHLENSRNKRGLTRAIRGRDKDLANFIRARDRPIINVQQKYKSCERKATNLGVFKTPKVPRQKYVTPSSSSNRPKSSTSNQTDNKTTSCSDGTNSFVIMAITSGRGDANCEIGIAAMDLRYPHLIISQISDTQTFTHTLTSINLFLPVEIVMPETLCQPNNIGSKLYSTIRDTLKNIVISPISRSHFNDNDGLERLKTHTADEYSSIIYFVKEKYYALAATAALFKYIEYIQHVTHAAKSMKVEFQCSENKMLIDVESAQNLELVSCLSVRINYFSLFGALNRCATPMGRRFLRASILQPPCDQSFIKSRQYCIAELISNRTLHSLVPMILRRLGGVDRLVHGLCVKTLESVDDDNVKIAERKLSYVLLLKHTLEILPELQSTLETAVSPFFKKVHENLGDSRFQIMLEQISNIVHEDARYVSGYTSSNIQRCFAIKAGINDMLDIARQIYCELIDNMKSLIDNLAMKYRLPLSLNCTALMGYHIQMSVPRRSNFKVSQLPKELINVERKRSTLYMTTQSLLVLNDNCKNVCEELHITSSVLLEELMLKLKESIACLYQLSDDISELDLIASLARISAISDFVEPKFGSKLLVRNSRHPIKDIFGGEEIVPNEIMATSMQNLKIITSPNKSGKTTYLTQIVLLQIMAQIGCRVPASEAHFRITNRVFCLSILQDDMKCNASTFIVEMKAIQHMFRSVNDKSLIILDEPCKNTSVEEGTTLAWEVCTRLASTNAFTFVTTHFIYLTQLANVYVNIKNFHFECTLYPEEGNTLKFNYKLMPGVTNITHYGIAVAKMTALPERIIERALQVCNNIAKTIEPVGVNVTKEQSQYEKYYAYFSKYVDLKESGNFYLSNVRRIVDEMRNDLILKDIRQIEVQLFSPANLEKSTLSKKCLQNKQGGEMESNTITINEDTIISPILTGTYEIFEEISNDKNTDSKVNLSALRVGKKVKDANQYDLFVENSLMCFNRDLKRSPILRNSNKELLETKTDEFSFINNIQRLESQILTENVSLDTKANVSESPHLSRKPFKISLDKFAFKRNNQKPPSVTSKVSLNSTDDISEILRRQSISRQTSKTNLNKCRRKTSYFSNTSTSNKPSISKLVDNQYFFNSCNSDQTLKLQLSNHSSFSENFNKCFTSGNVKLTVSPPSQNVSLTPTVLLSQLDKEDINVPMSVSVLPNFSQKGMTQCSSCSTLSGQIISDLCDNQNIQHSNVEYQKGGFTTVKQISPSLLCSTDSCVKADEIIVSNIFDADKSAKRKLYYASTFVPSPAKISRLQNISVQETSDITDIVVDTSAKKEAKIFQIIEGSNFNEKLFYQGIYKTQSDNDFRNRLNSNKCKCSQ